MDGSTRPYDGKIFAIILIGAIIGTLTVLVGKR